MKKLHEHKKATWTYETYINMKKLPGHRKNYISIKKLHEHKKLHKHKKAT